MQPLPETSQEREREGYLDFFPSPAPHLFTSASIGPIYLLAREQWNLGNVAFYDTEHGGDWQEMELSN